MADGVVGVADVAGAGAGAVGAVGADVVGVVGGVVGVLFRYCITSCAMNSAHPISFLSVFIAVLCVYKISIPKISLRLTSSSPISNMTSLYLCSVSAYTTEVDVVTDCMLSQLLHVLLYVNM